MQLKGIDCSPTTIMQNNSGKISWTEGVYGQQEVKGFGIKYCNVQDSVDSNICKPEYTS